MRRRSYFVIAAVVAAMFTSLTVTPAFAATDVLTVSNGANVAVGDDLITALASGSSATVSSGGMTIFTCSSSSFSTTVASNPAAPGTATGQIGSWTFSSCTGGWNAGFNLPWKIAFSDSPPSVMIAASDGPIQVTLKDNTIFGTITCVYQETSMQVSLVSTSPITIRVTIQFSKVSGPGTCPSSVTFMGTYGPVTDASQGNQPVSLN